MPFRIVLSLALLCAAHAALGDIFIVTNTNDAGPGSLRQALIGAAKAGADDIVFHLSGSATAGEYVIQPLSSLPDIPTGTRILGETQRLFGGDVNPLGPEIAIDGAQAGNGATGLRMTNASDCLVREVSVRRFKNNGIVIASGSNNKIEGCYVGTDGSGAATGAGNDLAGIVVQGSGHIIGGTDPAARNVISGNGTGVALDTASASVTIQGNFIGTNATGSAAIGNSTGIVLSRDSHDVVIGGSSASARNIISGNKFSGIYITGSNEASHNLIEGNFIGTDVTGMKAIGNGKGITLWATNYNIIGQIPPGARNVISGNHGAAVELVAGSRNNIIQSNYIGVAADGVTPLGNVALSFVSPGYGVYLSGGSNQFGHGEDNAIGGPAPEQGNVIAYNSDAGVAIVGGIGNSIHSNSIYANGTLGIDLGVDGPTINDPGDTDGNGYIIANEFQNFPALESVSFAGGVATIRGTLNSASNTSYRLEFFASPRANTHGFMQGESYLGSTDVVTDGSGHVAFQVNFSVPDQSVLVSATATDPRGNTSEFGGVPDKLANISTRVRVQTGDNILIGGFIVTGSQSKRVVIRAMGPSLTQAGIGDALQDPTLQLFSGGTLLAANDNWRESEAEIQGTGLAPNNDAESAIVRTLDPGAYTAIVRGKNNTTGVALVEAYDLDPGLNSKLANISTRGFVNDGENALIGGFIIPSQNGGGATIVVRALGPSLGDVGVPDSLPDPILALYDANGMGIGFNSDWKSTQQAELEKVGLAPTRDSEAAILITLTPGSYTAIVTPDLDLPGVGLVEVYQLQ